MLKKKIRGTAGVDCQNRPFKVCCTAASTVDVRVRVLCVVQAISPGPGGGDDMQERPSATDNVKKTLWYGEVEVWGPQVRIREVVNFRQRSTWARLNATSSRANAGGITTKTPAPKKKMKGREDEMRPRIERRER